MRKLTEKEIEELKEEIGGKSIETGEFFTTLQSMPKEKAKKIVTKWMEDNTKQFPKLAKLMIEKELITQKEFDEKWNHRDMYEIFLYILLGDVQKAKESKNEVVMVTTSDFKLKRKASIKMKFGVTIRDPKEAMEMMKKQDPKTFKKFEDEMRFQKKATDYIG